jgi:holo-[acyl-carrier protein] synthase
MLYKLRMSVGIDIIEVDRISRAIEKWGNRFIDRVFCAGEIARCRPKANPAMCFAAHFAAKEAFSKALGTGMRILRWKDIEVAHHETGKPYLIVRGKAKALLGNRNMDVSLSDTESLATALVVIESTR